jgi:hypothetical protein
MKKNEDSIYAKPAYKCALCEEIYESVQERASCEMACLKKKQEEERKAAEAKKKEQQENRYNEVNAALDNVYALVNKYVEDYGSFKYGGKYKGLDILNMDFFPSKLLHHFFF